MTTDPYVCPTCGRRFPVPSMATDCAQRHQEDQ